MLISQQLLGGTQQKIGRLKRSFVLQNKLHGSQDNACSTVKSKKRGDITRVPPQKKEKEKKECSLDWKTTSLLWLISAHGEGNSCFVASDWLKRW